MMPLMTLIVMLWIWSDRPGDFDRVRNYTVGVLFGIGPNILFFIVAYLCLRRHVSLPITLCASFAAWLLGAAVHLWLLHGLRPQA
jgi:uncharacterized membrane protein (GlpM family)